VSRGLICFWLCDLNSMDPGSVVNCVAKRPRFAGPSEKAFEIFFCVRLNQLEVGTDPLYRVQDLPDVEAISGVSETAEPFEDRVVVGDGPEGLAISPKGDVAVAVILAGSNNKSALFLQSQRQHRGAAYRWQESPR